MFVVTEADAAAIRAAFDQGVEFAAAIELRRLFPGVTDIAEARERQRWTNRSGLFPSWFIRITCDRCGKDRMVSEATQAGPSC